MPQTAIPPPRAIPDDLVGLQEMVDLFGVKRVTVDQWAFRRRAIANPELAFPVPDGYIGATPVWHLDRLQAWASATGRPMFEKEWREKRKAGAYVRSPRSSSTTK
jgi:hypothetical protein